MGKTNYVILGIGLAACVFLSILMQHALKAKQEHEIPPMVTELTRVYGARFASPVEFAVDTRGEHRIADCVVYPLMSSSGRRLVRKVGDYVWRNVDDEYGFDVLVVTTDDGFGNRVRYQVPSPMRFNAPLKVLGEDEAPSAPPSIAQPVRPAATPKAAPAGQETPTAQPTATPPQDASK